jgi:L-rhamnose mutarotase
MERACFYLRILPGTEEEFDRRHADIWPKLVREVRASGLRNLSGFRRGTNVWLFFEAQPDVSTGSARQAGRPVNRAWNPDLRHLFAETTDGASAMQRYEEVFHSDGPALDGPFERALFGLVIDPDQAAEYEALHANPWPDALEAIEASGVRNYTGFRRGAHVVYYGEFYPDKATAFARLATFEASARWGEALEGLITTITDLEGNHIAAEEFHHQD